VSADGRRPLIAGNWKMNKTTPEAREFCASLRPLVLGADAEVAVCPPYPSIEAVVAELQGTAVWVAAQNVHEGAKGAFTGEVSAPMLVAAGARGAIVGHSERRAMGETDAQVAARIRAALEAGLAVIACVGESQELRDAGETERWLTGQVRAALHGLGREATTSLVIAYEPIWAIGTGRTATPEIAQEACALVRQVAGEVLDPGALRVLYGGSVIPDNAGDLLAQPDIDGALVGGASLDPEGFARIVAAA
jgi:triosephosphate isomerase (TIM)